MNESEYRRRGLERKRKDIIGAIGCVLLVVAGVTIVVLVAL